MQHATCYMSIYYVVNRVITDMLIIYVTNESHMTTIFIIFCLKSASESKDHQMIDSSIWTDTSWGKNTH